MKTKRVWLVFIGCMLLYGAIMGVLFNCTGILISGVISAENFSSSSISLFYTLRGLISAIAMLFVAKLLVKYNIKLIIVAAGIICSVSYLLMYVYTKPWHWCISGVLSGMGVSVSLLLPTSVIRVWFVKKRGTFMGIFTMASGLLGAMLNPVVSSLIETFGWRNTAVILGVTAFVLIMLSALLIVRNPADVGAIPFGGRDVPNAYQRESVRKEGKKVPIELRYYVFIFFTASISGLCIQSTSYIPQYSASMNYPLMVGATLTSAIMIGNLSAKLLFGLVSDWLGVWKSIGIFNGLICISYVFFILFGDRLGMMYVASVLLGFAYMSGVGQSLVCMELFEPEDYEIHYSRVSMTGNLIAASVPSLIALLFDTTGSFQVVFLIFTVLLVISMVLIATRRKIGIRKAADKIGV